MESTSSQPTTMQTNSVELQEPPFEPLVRRILTESTVIGDKILKIDHFLNHRIEPKFMTEMGQALADRLRVHQPDLILTAEASGIAPALAVSIALNLPMVFAKKYAPDVETPALSRVVPSPTKGGETKLVVSRRYLTQGLRVAIVDDFLANGKTALALTQLVQEAGSQCVCAGFFVEKSFQGGRKPLQESGIPIIALAIVESLQQGQVRLKGV